MGTLRASRRRAVVIAACCAWGVIIAPATATRTDVQPDASAEIVERMRACLDAYEPKLSELVADEEFLQRTPSRNAAYGEATFARRLLVSDVGFLRLPGGLAWLAQRSVRSVDGVPVAADLPRLEDALVSAGAQIFARAKTIADANAKYNLGHPRSMNVPTLPLDLLGRRRQHAFRVDVEGPDTLGGRKAVRVAFREPPPGAIIAHDKERFLRADVVAWLSTDSGAVLRADVTLDPPGYGRHRIRVDFAAEPALGLLVPVRMTESDTGFPDGDGSATYGNYRRFQTAGRILPPR